MQDILRTACRQRAYARSQRPQVSDRRQIEQFVVSATVIVARTGTAKFRVAACHITTLMFTTFEGKRGGEEPGRGEVVEAWIQGAHKVLHHTDSRPQQSTPGYPRSALS